MKKLTILIVIAIMITFVAPAFAADQWELGLSITPLPGAPEGDDNVTPGFHFAYNWWYIAYATWDSIVLPPWVIQDWTGYLRPGFLNLFDLGARITIGPFLGYAEMGINYLYLYKQFEQELDIPKAGANIRVGAGVKMGWWGANVSLTSVFPSFADVKKVIGGLFHEKTRSLALDAFMKQAVPSINLVMYF